MDTPLVLESQVICSYPTSLLNLSKSDFFEWVMQFPIFFVSFLFLGGVVCGDKQRNMIKESVKGLSPVHPKHTEHCEK